jgi:hypothetical protein
MKDKKITGAIETAPVWDTQQQSNPHPNPHSK